MSNALPHIASPSQNELLAALSPATQIRLFPLLELCALQAGKVLFERGDALTHLYFPANSVISLVTVMNDGTTVEISTVGREGLVGVALLMGSNTTSSRAIVQYPGHSWRLPVDVLRKDFGDDGELLRLALHYTQCLVTQMTHAAVCYHYHSAEQQLARWLLVALDRRRVDDLELQHVLDATLPGARRSAMEAAAESLRKAGIIRYSRGKISIVDPEQLAERSCECYRVVKTEIGRLMGGVLATRSAGAQRK